LRLDEPARVGVHGRVTVTAVDTAWLSFHRSDTGALLDPPSQAVRARESGGNVMCTAGLSLIASALVWSGIEDQAAGLGVSTPAYLAPLYGAAGGGSGTANPSDTALFSEIARSTAGAGASSPATSGISAVAAYLFFFPPPSSSWTVTEAGVFGQATADSGSGVLLDHYVLSSPVVVTSPDSCLIQVSFAVSGS
jgi:hypothetical protein